MWSFRLVRTSLPDGGIRYAMHEAVYGLLGGETDSCSSISEMEKHGISWTEDPVGPEYYFKPGELDDVGVAVRAIRQELMDMFKSTTWPILNGDTETGMPLIKAVGLSDDD